MKKFRDWFLLNVVLPAGIFIFKIISYTFTFKVQGGENTTPYKGKTRNYIYIFWHSVLLAPVCYYRNLGIVSLVSLSKDGEIATRVAESFGFKIVRGSSFKGAAKGLLELKELALQGRDISINTDGPRGPVESVGNGAIYLAKLTGLEIVPFGFSWEKRIRMTSWDAFQAPLPFSKGIFKFGAPVKVAQDAGETEVEGIRLKLEQELKKLNNECEEYFGRKK